MFLSPSLFNTELLNRDYRVFLLMQMRDVAPGDGSQTWDTIIDQLVNKPLDGTSGNLLNALEEHTDNAKSWASVYR